MGRLDEGGQKVQTSSYKMNKYRDAMYNMINIIKTAVCCIWKLLRVNPKSSHYKEKIFFSFSFILYLYEVMDVC